MDMEKLLIGIFWFTLGHIAVFFQLNGQFKWEWFAKNEWALVITWVNHFIFLYLGDKIYCTRI